jgi:hypothetical protein
MANSPRFDTTYRGVTAPKSFGILMRSMGVGAGAKKNRRNSPSPATARMGTAGLKTVAARETHRAPEARYAYYRRCQHFRSNGEQCKAPAVKGESICHQHAQQADNECRRERQRRELLARPGVGFASFQAIQRTISELAGAILAGTIDGKTAGRLIIDIQNAIRLQRRIQRSALSTQSLNFRLRPDASCRDTG